MASDFKINIEGATETAHMFQKASLQVPLRLHEELRKGAGMVADAAKLEAVGKGDVYKGVGDHGDPSRHSGDLAKKISVRKAGVEAFDVTEYSRTRTKRYPGGYTYPRQLEYGPGGRAFMRPAAEKMTPVVTKMVDVMLDRLFLEEGF